MTIDRPKLRTTGFKALSDFLHKLHVYKSIGDYETAEKFFNHYSQVDEDMLKVREIVMANKVPRRLELQPNVFYKDESSIDYKNYDETFEGIVQSYVERWEGAFLSDVYAHWIQDAEKVRY